MIPIYLCDDEEAVHHQLQTALWRSTPRESPT